MLSRQIESTPPPQRRLTCATLLICAGARLSGGEVVLAVENLHFDLLSATLVAGGSPNEKDKYGRSALHLALRKYLWTKPENGAIFSIVTQLLEYGAMLLGGETVTAIASGDWNLVSLLLKYGGSLLETDTNGTTALEAAIQSGNSAVLNKLLEDPACYGEDPEVASYRHKDDYGVSFWRIANQTKGSPLTFCAMANATEACRELLQRGFCPDKLTWVIISAENDQSMAQILIDNGQKLGDNLNNPLIPTQNPLLGAITHRNKDLVLLLLQAGVEINENDETIRYNRSPLQLAAELGDLDIADCLLKAGADVNGAPARYHGGTALQLAAAQAHIGLAKHLIESGADVNAPPSKYRGRTALEAAAEHGRLDMVDLLLSHGVLTTGKGQHHYIRSVQLALSEGHNTVAHILKKCRDWSEEDDRLFEIQDPEDYSEDGSEDGSEGDREYEHGNAGESDMAAFLGFEHRNAANEGNVGELDMTAFFDFPAAGDEIMTNSS
ncbi:ankyrin [Thozetella sp. PMI_491]|nr:ankyrin [Thozetella sp. PMI_491]